jgi:hypothetical protein
MKFLIKQRNLFSLAVSLLRSSSSSLHFPSMKSPHLFATLTLALPSLAAAATLDYNRDIRPILSENCFSCHGFDEKGRKAKLRLDVAAEAYADKDGVSAIKPSDLNNSEAWQRIISDDEDELMPPPKSHLALSAADKAKIKLWIEQGAAYAGHWAFLPPQRPALPAGAEQAIDALVRKRLHEEGLQPAPLAAPHQLIRRLFIDLTGLPPSAEEVTAFAADPSPEAYQTLVERLLKSPHFGERLALDWLDAARYADTNGFSIDGGRHLWLWRDWVIQAFNDNKPYDQFLTEQLAGDLLPNTSEAQLIATGFQRNNMVTHEGGTIPEENLTNYNADRVKTLGEAVLGLTLGCAQCHDHKFDPISQKDYFELFAYFNSLDDLGLDGNGGVNPRPHLRAKTVLKSNEIPVLEKQIAALQQRLNTPDPKVFQTWETVQLKALQQRGKELQILPLTVQHISTPNRSADFAIQNGNEITFAQVGTMGAFDIVTQLPATDLPITGLRVTALPSASAPSGGLGHGPGEARPRKAKADAPTAPDFIGNFVLTAIATSVDQTPADQVNLHQLLPIQKATASTWQPDSPPADALHPLNETGWSPLPSAETPARFTITFAQPLQAKEKPYLTVQLNFGRGQKFIPAHLQLHAITGSDDDSDLPPAIIAALQTPAEQRSEAEKKALWDHCAAHHPALDAIRIRLANLQERLAVLTQPYPTMVMNVSAKPRETFILNRGDYSQPTTKVEANTLSALPPPPTGAPSNRLGLAQWITMPEHPLTARVAVNRFWKMLFGTGIVATAADFGMQGEWPSHPEVLDWLAVEFVESGWDVKHLIRLIVTSQTYQQTSVPSAELLERDPQNRLLARGPRFRLPAELLRDAALKTSGLLVPRIGGPSVNPYMPGDLWREVSHYGSSPATAQTFIQDHGEKLYRRSLYTYWKRTAPPPNMTAFDAPNREVCTIERGNTITPLQALVTLNDPQFVEAARTFAQRILQHSSKSDAERLQWAVLEATSRPASATDLATLSRTLNRERSHYQAQPQLATAALQVGESPRDRRLPAPEHAAWMQIASLLLNLSESLTRN